MMTRQEMLEIALHADGLSLPIKAMAIMAINVATTEQLRQAAVIFEEAERTFAEQGLAGLKTFLLQMGVPKEGVEAIIQYAPKINEHAADSHTQKP